MTVITTSGKTRQQVLILHLATKSLDSSTVAWAIYDGTAPAGTSPAKTGAEQVPPYSSVVDALYEGWKLIQLPQCVVIPGREHDTSVLPYEFVLTREVVCDE